MSVPAIDLSPADLDAVDRNLAASGWPVPTRLHDLTIFGIRNATPASDKYDDAVGYRVIVPGLGRVGQLWRATTKPGRRALLENRAAAKGGVFTLADEMRHLLLWVLGLHHDRLALVHRYGAEAKGWRDGDGDAVHDAPPALHLGAGINCHDPGVIDPSNVGNSSEGCIVPWRAAFVEVLRTLVQRQATAGMGGAASFALWRGSLHPDLDALRVRVAA